MKLLYKPFGIIAGVIGAKVGQSVFNAVWARIEDAEPPQARSEAATLPKVVFAQALQAATLAGTSAAVERLSMRWFHYLTGIWPGDKPEHPTDGAADPVAPVAAA